MHNVRICRAIYCTVMPVIISMLRGVNLVRHNRIKMDALLALYKSLGLQDCQTYVQSGNVVFRIDSRAGKRIGESQLVELSRRIECAIEQHFGFRTDVLLRTVSEMRDVIARNPFAKRRGIDPRKLQVFFLANAPGAEACDKLRAIKIDPEELRIDGRELYICFPNGFGRANLSWPRIGRTLKTPLTSRNWNTVTQLLEIAESFGP